jgi:hypothetical protein
MYKKIKVPKNKLQMQYKSGTNPARLLRLSSLAKQKINEKKSANYNGDRKSMRRFAWYRVQVRRGSHNNMHWTDLAKQKINEKK